SHAPVRRDPDVSPGDGDPLGAPPRMVLVARRAVKEARRRGFMPFSVARTTRPALGALLTPGHGPGTPGRPRTGGAAAPSGTLPGDLVTCGAHAGPGPCARPALGRAAHSAASRSMVQVQDHGPSAAVPAGVARGLHWGSSLLTCGRPHAPSSQRRCWGPMV